MDIRSPRAILALLAVLSLAAATSCGGDSPTEVGPQPPSGPTEAAAPTATSTTLGPMQEIELSGLPAGRTDLQADITAEGAGSAAQPGPYQMPLFPTAAGRYRLVIPLHPVSGVGGGAVDVRVRGDGGLVTAPLRLTLAPLPAAPGAFAASLDSLQLLVDLALEGEGLTRADVLAANARDVLPKRLLPLAIVQTLLDDPAHDRDLRDLLGGSTAFAPLIGTSQFDHDLVDRLVAAAGLPSFWNEMLDSARATGPAPAGMADAAAARAAPAASTPMGAPPAQAGAQITNAYDLHTAMRRAWDAKRAIDPSNPTTKVREDVGLALGAAGIFAGPAAGAVIAGVSISQFLVNTTLEAIAKTLPSEFVPNSMKFEVDIARFLEDEPGPGRYSEIKVSATSDGMVLDKVILNAVLQVVGGTRAAGSLFQAPSGSKTITDWITDVGSFITETVAGKVPDADGMLRIPPETWSDIPLVSDLWTNARLTGTAISLGDEPTYLPVEPGEALLTVETSLAHFGDAAPAFARETIEVAPIQVEVAASRTTVTPGEVVTLDIRVLDALNPGLEYRLSSGSWVSGPTYLGNNSWHAEILTPTATGQFPVEATFTSTATGGARSTPGAPDRSATVRILTGTILVEPHSAMLLPGESQTFTATVLGLENKAVTWSAIGPDGGTAPISATAYSPRPPRSASTW